MAAAIERTLKSTREACKKCLPVCIFEDEFITFLGLENSLTISFRILIPPDVQQSSNTRLAEHSASVFTANTIWVLDVSWTSSEGHRLRGLKNWRVWKALGFQTLRSSKSMTFSKRNYCWNGTTKQSIIPAQQFLWKYVCGCNRAPLNRLCQLASHTLA